MAPAGQQPSNSDRGVGLRIYRASRLEALIPPLSSLLDQSWSDNLLEPQVVVAAHAGMKQWLVGALARHKGVAGIVANLDVVLPSTWLDRLAQARLGAQAVSLPRYQRAQLRWSLHEMLVPGRIASGVTDPRIAKYLAIDDDGDPLRAAELARRRFQLADRLARVYSQYLVYRPDWLKAWEGGQFKYATKSDTSAGLSALESQLLAPLWKKLASRLGRHRGQVIEDLQSSLANDDCPRPTLHVFGSSHLAPAEVGILRAYARQALVALYVPDPCREYWGGLKVDDLGWQAYRDQEKERIEKAGEGDYWQEQDHPLLARWGRMGQHFFSALTDGEVSEDIRHWQDQRPDTPVNRLQRLQESIRQLNPALMAVDLAGESAATAETTDSSLRIHACHTRLRELEVLRDNLLDAMDEQGIQPGEMVVMAPDIQAYLPLIPAVFGAPGMPGNPGERMPYHLADVPVVRGHRLFNSLQCLLGLPGQRISTPEVMDLLSMPEIQRRLGIDQGDADNLGEWLDQSRVAWALDGAHRARFGVPAIAEHSFAWAVDRMIAGYLMSDAPEADRDRAFVFPDGTELAPVTGVHGPSAEALGALDRLLQWVQAWLDLSSRSLRASEWAGRIELYLDGLFRIDGRDKEAGEAWTAIRRFVRALATEPEAADEDPILHFSVVRDLLVERLAAVPERQRFLMGGITFCGMVPQRAIPFRLVAVLGLNDGEFPRNASDGGIDLMTRLRRIGDRDVRSDDRYLFLETVMSARDRLHLSFVGEGVKDGKPRNPAAPLAELLAELDLASGLAHDARSEQRPWFVKHPLQPFDGRYFDGSDARLFSYDKRYEAMHGSGREPPKPFLRGSSGAADAVPEPLALSEIRAYYKDPARNLLERRLKLRLDALDEDQLRGDEPLEDKLDPISTVARKVFFNEVLPAWPEDAWAPAVAASWLRLTGLLPPGRLGDAAWNRELRAINALLAAARSTQTLDRHVATQSRQEPLDVQLADSRTGSAQGYRITGKIRDVFPLAADDGMGLQLLRAFPAVNDDKAGLKAENDLHFGERVPIFLDWALLRLQTARSGGPLLQVRITLLVKPDEKPWETGLAQWDDALLRADAVTQATMLEDLQQRVVRLIEWWHQAQRQPHWYFARTSWKAISEAMKKPEELDAAPGQEADIPDDARENSMEPQSTARLDSSAIRHAWSSHDGSGERYYGSGYNRLLAGDVEFDADAPETALLLVFAGQLDAVISMHASDRETQS